MKKYILFLSLLLIPLWPFFGTDTTVSPSPDFSPQPEPAPTPACIPGSVLRLAGYVCDGGSGKGIEDAEVKVSVPGSGERFPAFSAARSVASGYFILSHEVCREPLVYALKISREGYTTLQIQVNSAQQARNVYYLESLVTPAPEATPLPTPTMSPAPEQKLQFIPAYTEAYLSEPGFSTEIYIINSTRPLAAYGLVVLYDPEILEVDRGRGGTGVRSGREGFIAAVNSNEPGFIIISGFDIDGETPPERMHLATLFWKARKPGYTALDLHVISMADSSYQAIPMDVRDGLVCVDTVEPGDLNKDTRRDMIDALVLAEYLLGKTAPEFDVDAADTNHDGHVDWLDAMFLAGSPGEEEES